VFDDESVAAEWLRAPNLALGDVAPLAMADTELGAREVDDLLGRIEYGVYS
jgi:putative toxin-antitoxin system antitoxin component (TIGR02293 family)